MRGLSHRFAYPLGFMLVLLLGAGCIRNTYVVPNPLIEDYAKRIPLTVGVLLTPDVREEWFEWKSESQRRRVDVPVGKLAFDYAHAGMRRAFENFYVERFYDRRSEKGLLVMVDRIEYSLQGSEVVLATDIRIEDESGSVVLSKTYRVRGKVAGNPIVRIPFVSRSRAETLEQNTNAAFRETYRQLVLDILVLVGIVDPPASPSPIPAEESQQRPEPAEVDVNPELPAPPAPVEAIEMPEEEKDDGVTVPEPVELPQPAQIPKPVSEGTGEEMNAGAVISPPPASESPPEPPAPAPPAKDVSPEDLPRPWQKP